MPTTQQLFEQFDWSATELGPVQAWPQSLRSYVSMILEMPWPAIIFWGDNQIQIYNDGYAVIMGPRHPRYFGASYRDCWPDTYPTIYPWMRKVLDRGEVVEVQRTHIPLTRFGFDEEAYFTFIFSPLRDDAGRITGILQPVFEVTTEVLSARRAELLTAVSAVARESHPLSQLATAIGTCPLDIPFALVWRSNAEGRLAALSRVGAQALPAQALAQLEAAAEEVAASGVPRVVDALGVPAGPGEPVRPAAERALLLPLDGAGTGPTAGAIAFGISARLHFDEHYRQFLEQAARQVGAALHQAAALQEQERRRAYLNELFQQAPAGIAILAGPDHVFELVNPIYRSLIAGRDVVGLPLRQALPELADQPFEEILDEVYRSGVPYVGREMPVRLLGGDGGCNEVVFNFLYQPLRDAQGAVSGILVMCYDVTAQVRERERAELLATELKQEHRRKDEFLAMLAHELRNPLAPISSAAEVLSQGGLDAGRQRWASELIARQVEHMASLVDDLIDVSRVTRGLVDIERQRLDLKRVVAEATEQVRPLLQSRRQQLQVLLPDAPVHLRGDAKRLVQVLANLLNNSAKYTPAGGAVALEVSLRPGQACIVVRDNGIGMAPDLLPRVFDLFVQGERSGDRSQGGLGIGLALVRTLVELHGGTVTASSEGLGRGSEFTVLLPFEPQPDVPGGHVPAGSAPMPSSARRLLVVDDNVDAADALALLLSSLGHEVVVAHDGPTALDAVTADCPDICLLDIGLPGMDGYELARRIRALPRGAQPLLVALTGYGQESDRRTAAAAGFDRYIVKPLDADELLTLLDA